MNVDYFSTLNVDSKPRYKQKLDIVGIKYCPYRLAADIWCDNVIEYPNIYDYLINTPCSYV